MAKIGVDGLEKPRGGWEFSRRRSRVDLSRSRRPGDPVANYRPKAARPSSSTAPERSSRPTLSSSFLGGALLHQDPPHPATVQDDRDLIVRPVLPMLPVGRLFGRTCRVGEDLNSASRDVDNP